MCYCENNTSVSAAEADMLKTAEERVVYTKQMLKDALQFDNGFDEVAIAEMYLEAVKAPRNIRKAFSTLKRYGFQG